MWDIKSIFTSLIIYSVLNIIVVQAKSINNESDFLDIIKTNKQNELAIEINSRIVLQEDCHISNSFEKVTIVGSSKESSIIRFLNIKDQLYFSKNVKEIELKNISIQGNIYFDNNIKITLDTVNINGNINSDFTENNNEYIKMINIHYHADGIPATNCINLSGNIEINDSWFFGSSLCEDRILNFEGYNKYDLKIKGSYFNGNNQCSCLHINKGLRITIEESSFEKVYGPENIVGGAIKITNSYTIIRYCTFRDILSVKEGGALYLDNIYEFTGEYLDVYNTTSLEMGSMAFVTSELDNVKTAKFRNIRQYDTGNIKNIMEGGLIMGLRKGASVDIENYYANNLVNMYRVGCSFNVYEDSKLNVRNIEIHNAKSNYIDAVFVNSMESNSVEITATNVTLNNCYQYNENNCGLLVWFNKNTKGTLQNIKVTNSGGHNARLIYVADSCPLKIDNLEVDNYFTTNTQELIITNSASGINSIIEINNIKLNNIQNEGAIFSSLNYLDLTVTNAEIKNVNLCRTRNDCRLIKDDSREELKTTLIHMNDNSKAVFKNVKFENVYGDRGLTSYKNGKISIYDSSFINCHFNNGIMEVDNFNERNGNFYIENTSFKNNYSNYGSVLNIQSLEDNFDKKITFINCNFEGNTVTKFGGVIYSIGKKTHDYVTFENCEFTNNHAEFGDIAYSLSIDAEPQISNIEDLRKIKGQLVTNPSKIIIMNSADIQLSSGDKIPEGIHCSIYDDYDNLIFFGSDITSIELNDLVSFTIESVDEYNTEVYGQTKSYCWDTSCIFTPVKVIGNPGTYPIRLRVQTFGQYQSFVNNYVDLEVRIKDCDNAYIYQQTDSLRLKSCYLPTCNPNCNGGECININVCNCAGTLFTGSNCNEYYKLERITGIDRILRGIITCLFITTVVLIFLILFYKNNQYIKAGGTDLLIIILVGIIINLVYVSFLTMNRTKGSCYILYMFYNIGFSLVFGTILIKTLRIYKIFCYNTGVVRIIKRQKMYLIIFSLVLIHLIFGIIWMAHGQFKLVPDLTSDSKEYLKCDYSKAKTLSIIINFAVLAVGSFLSYSIRKVEKKFREDLVIPVYVYVLFTVITEIVNLNDEISVLVQDLFNVIGTIIITTVILIFLFINKFYYIYVIHSIELRKSKSTIIGSKNNLGQFKSKSIAALDLDTFKNMPNPLSNDGSIKNKSKSQPTIYNENKSKSQPTLI